MVTWSLFLMAYFKHLQFPGAANGEGIFTKIIFYLLSPNDAIMSMHTRQYTMASTSRTDRTSTYKDKILKTSNN